MRRIQKRLVRQLQELLVQRLVEHGGQLLGAPALSRAQVGAADVADEQRVPAEHRVGPLRIGCQVVDQQRDGLRRVARSPEHLQAHRGPQVDARTVAVGDELVVGIRASPQVDGGTRTIAQLEMAGQEIGVEVSQEDVTDLAARLLRHLQITPDIPLWIDDRSDTAAVVGHEVRRVREAAQVVLLQDHASRT
jgi:hypothetical protein